MQQKKLLFVGFGLLFVTLISCDTCSKAKLEANKDVVHRFVDALNNQEFNLLDDLVASDFVRHSQATADAQVRSLEEFKELQKEFLKSFPDQRVTGEILIAEGDYVAGYATYTGTQEEPMGSFPASGKKVESKFLSLFRLEEGKIVELWVEYDNLAMLKQLGHLPLPEERKE